MQYAIVNIEEERKKVLADYNLERMYKGYYVCPVCGEPVYLRKPRYRVPHFAHYPDSRRECNAEWEPESVEHVMMKRGIKKLLESVDMVSFVEEEYPVGTHLADVYFEANGYRIAVECQNSGCSFRRMEEKTKYYLEHDVYTIWVTRGKVRSPEVRFGDIKVVNRYYDRLYVGVYTGEWKFTGVDTEKLFDIGVWNKYDIELACFVPDVTKLKEALGEEEVEKEEEEDRVVPVDNVKADLVVDYGVIKGRNVYCRECGSKWFDREFGCVAGFIVEGDGVLDIYCDCGRIVRVKNYSSGYEFDEI